MTAPEAAELCEWLDAIAFPDGGLPFALRIEDPSGCAPFWADADPHAFSLQITAIVAANANRVAAQDPAVAAYPWLARTTSRCLAAVDALEAAPEAYVLAFAIRFLDAVYERSSASTRCQYQPPSPAPWINTYVAIRHLPSSTVRSASLSSCEPADPDVVVLTRSSPSHRREHLTPHRHDAGGGMRLEEPDATR